MNYKMMINFIQIKSLKEQINKDEIRLYDLKKKIKGYLNCTIIKMEIDNKQFIKLINEEKHFTKGKIFRIFNECLTGE